MESYELMHYGVKGMKWGVRKKRHEFQRDGSERTVKRLNALFDADKRYGPSRNRFQDKKISKLYKRYDKSVAKDIKRAVKVGDTKAANSMAAGRTYLRMMMNQQFLSRTISDTAVRAKVEAGKNFTYNVLRDDAIGGVKVTVNGHSETYTYLPELKRNRE